MKPLLNASAVAALLGVSRAAAYREMKKMVHVVIGDRTLRVTKAALDNYLKQRMENQSCARRSASTGRRTTPSGTGGSTTPMGSGSVSAPSALTGEQQSSPLSSE